ncbi:helix-turn-helix domain-containing protein [Oleomonas cavernae]|uniref:Helix-turn-helix domain-containing protein n=1 Tax=Oleomonas cavernae TaxID=2320859 RepID=A0A418WCV4_9PROT|nr:helix-turn-helix domain-containing protein [Oleomonas cavernae]
MLYKTLTRNGSTLVQNRLAELRRRAGLTQDQLAERAETGRSQIVKLERGERRLTVDWMLRLARALNCEPKDLLPPEPGPAPTPSAPSGPGPPAPAACRRATCPSAGRRGAAPTPCSSTRATRSNTSSARPSSTAWATPSPSTPWATRWSPNTRPATSSSSTPTCPR